MGLGFEANVTERLKLLLFRSKLLRLNPKNQVRVGLRSREANGSNTEVNGSNARGWDEGQAGGGLSSSAEDDDGTYHPRLFVGVSQSQLFRDVVNIWR